MKKYLNFWCISLVLLMGTSQVFSAEEPRNAELDSFWAEVIRTVSEGDFEGYKKTYHQDAVVVSGISNTSKPVSQALAEWQDGFTQTRLGNSKATLSFRFTQRINDATTAHETGIFRYGSSGEDGLQNAVYIHFEALLIKRDGWKTLMEYQTAMASLEEWAAAELEHD